MEVGTSGQRQSFAPYDLNTTPKNLLSPLTSSLLSSNLVRPSEQAKRTLLAVFTNAKDFIVQDTSFNSITAHTVSIPGEGV